MHHAELLVGPHEACLAHIPEEHRTGPDAELIVADKLTIELARALSLRAQSRPVVAERRHFIVSCAEFMHEAQSALLKLLEDPPESARFSIIAPRTSLLLPTLRSRLSLRMVVDEAPEDSGVREFLASSYRERLARIAEFQKAKDTRGMRVLIEGVERTVATASLREKRTALPDVVLASRSAEIRGGSPKMLLEHLALSIPTVRLRRT